MRAAVKSVVLSTVVLTAAATAAVSNAAAHAAPVPVHATGKSEHVIVLLRDTHSFGAASADVAARQQQVAADQQPVRSWIGRLGGRTVKAYRVVDALAATVPAGGIAALRANPAVSAVVPDLQVREVRPEQVNRADASRSATPADASGAQYCPSDPSKPQLEPEALELTHTASDQAYAKTARSLGYTGAGVKVGIIADGFDVRQPDLIRPDGSKVVVDYQDFSGDGVRSVSSGAEAMGDVSSIAAQGRTSYDISKFVNPAHPLPAGCTIRIEGMSPAASVVALKIFNNSLYSAPASTIVQAIDYAIDAHVDVLNESFGSNPYPDTAHDPISLANKAAVDAGITVVASSGDAGSGNTMGTASTAPWMIAAGASTAERVYAQIGAYGYPLSNGNYTSDQISSLSSGGIAQTNRVNDLIAPGDLNWALCSDRLTSRGNPQYVGCADYSGTNAPSPIQVFGGTSESAPLTAGAAALVIQAYREHHDGASPSPKIVREILDSTSDDIGAPAQDQGAGLLDTYRAVQLAAAWHAQGGGGTELSVDHPQFGNVARAGSQVTNTVTVTNHGSATQQVSAGVRTVDRVVGQQRAEVPFDAATAPVMIDLLGRERPYTTKTFTVPVGTDRLDALASVVGDGLEYLRISLLDPTGAFAGYSLPQGASDITTVDVQHPAAGTWTAILWSGAANASVAGPITFRTTDYATQRAGTVSPASVRLAPGASQQFTVTTTAPSSDATAASVVFTHSGESTLVSVVDRAVQLVTTQHATHFSGHFVTGNGRDSSPAQTDTYLVDVPSGARDLDVDVSIEGTPANDIMAVLSDPSGDPIAVGLNQAPASDGSSSSYSGLQLVHADPRKGRYQLTVELLNQSAGAALPRAFHGTFTLNGAQVAAGLPNGASVSKTAGTTATVHIVNTSPVPQTYFLDGRSAGRRTYHLVASDVAGDPSNTDDPYSREVTLPLSGDDVLPTFSVPTQVSKLTVASTASAPITFDTLPLDNPAAGINPPQNPDIVAQVSGRSATATYATHEVTSAVWAALPSPLGPTPPSGITTTTATFRADVVARAFDADVTSAPGDPLLATVDASAAPSAPITLAPGASANVRVRFLPHSAMGSTHNGTLYVDIAQPYGPSGFSTLTEQVAALPYSYTVTG